MDDFTSKPLGREAVLHFSISDYRFVQPGEFVRCAVSGEPIPLDALRYWNAELQEPYGTAQAMLERHTATARVDGQKGDKA